MFARLKRSRRDNRQNPPKKPRWEGRVSRRLGEVTKRLFLQGSDARRFDETFSEVSGYVNRRGCAGAAVQGSIEVGLAG
jgi:hypothetical protein